METPVMIKSIINVSNTLIIKPLVLISPKQSTHAPEASKDTATSCIRNANGTWVSNGSQAANFTSRVVAYAPNFTVGRIADSFHMNISTRQTASRSLTAR